MEPMAPEWWHARAPARCSTRTVIAAKVSTPPRLLVTVGRGLKTIHHSSKKPARTPTVIRSTTRPAHLRVAAIR